METELRQTPDLLRRGLGLLYGVGIGYPLVCAVMHIVWNLNDHSLILLVLPLLLPVVALILVLGLYQAAWTSKLIQGLKQALLMFLASLGMTLVLVFLDILHCGFGD